MQFKGAINTRYRKTVTSGIKLSIFAKFPLLTGTIFVSRNLILATAVTLLILCCRGRAAAPPNDAFALEGTWPGYRRGPTYALVVKGNLAYCAMNEAGLSVVDLQADGGPRVVNRLELPGNCQDLVVRGDFAYLALVGFGVGIVDLSQPTSPVLQKIVPAQLAVRVVTMKGVAQLGVANGSKFEIYDITTPLDPQLLGSYPLPNYYSQVITEPGRLFVNSVYGMQIIDITNPQSPSSMGEFHIGQIQTASIAISGNYGFVSLYGTGLSVVDLSDSTRPKEVARLPFKWVQTMAIVGNRLVVIDLVQGTIEFDIGTPSSPTEIGRLNWKPAPMVPHPFVDGNRIWLPMGANGIGSVRLNDPAGPTIDQQSDLESGHVSGFTVRGDRVYVADGYGGMKILRWRPPGAPEVLGRFGTNTYIEAVSVSGDRAAILSFGQVTFLDVSNPSQIRSLGNAVAAPGKFFYPGSILLGPEHAYMGGQSLSVCRLSDLPNCTAADVPGLGLGTMVGGLVLHENHLYAFTERSIGIFALDDPGHPRLIGQHRAPILGRSWSFATIGFVGDLGLASTDSFGLEAVDMYNLESPRPLGNSLPWRRFGTILPYGPWGLGPVDGVLSLLDLTDPVAVTVHSPNAAAIVYDPIQLSGNHLFATDGNGSIIVRQLPIVPPMFLRAPPGRQSLPQGNSITLNADVSGSSPLNFRWLRDGYPVPGQTGNQLKIDDSDPAAEGRYSVEVTNPAGKATSSEIEVRRESPVKFTKALQIAGPARSVVIDGNHAYLCMGIGGLACMDIRRPTFPVERWRKNLGGEVNDVQIRGGLAYVAGGEQGFTILDAESGIIVGQINVGASSDLELWGDYAYISTTTGLVSVGIADPHNPQYINKLTGLLAPVSITRSGSIMLGAVSGIGIFKFDLSRLEPLVAVDLLPVGNEAKITSSGDRAIVADFDQYQEGPVPTGLHTFDLNKPADAKQRSFQVFPFGVQAMSLVGNRLYVASTNGIAVVDYFNATSPRTLGELPLSLAPLNVSVYRNTLWLADANEGFVVFEVSGTVPAHLELIRRPDNSMELRWPWGGGLLEQSPDLLKGPWIPIPESSRTESWLPGTTDTNMFFRLSFP